MEHNAIILLPGKRVVLSFFILLVSFACTKPDQADNKPIVYTHLTEVGTNQIPDLILASAVVVDQGEAPLLERGLLFSIDPEPDQNNSLYYVSDTLGEGPYYTIFYFPPIEESVAYIRAFATNTFGTSYGNTQKVKKPFLWPDFTEMSASLLDLSTIQLKANVKRFGEHLVIQRGWVWLNSYQTGGNPTLENCIGFTEEGPGMDPIISILNGYPTDFWYRFRPYIKTNERNYYSEYSVTIEDYISPQVELSWEILEPSSLLLQGQAFYGLYQMVRIGETGFCYSSHETPTISDNLITARCCSYSPFHATANNLEPGSTYYVRAFAWFFDSLVYSPTGTVIMP